MKADADCSSPPPITETNTVYIRMHRYHARLASQQYRTGAAAWQREAKWQLLLWATQVAKLLLGGWRRPAAGQLLLLLGAYRPLLYRTAIGSGGGQARRVRIGETGNKLAHERRDLDKEQC